MKPRDSAIELRLRFRLAGHSKMDLAEFLGSVVLVRMHLLSKTERGGKEEGDEGNEQFHVVTPCRSFQAEQVGGKRLYHEAGGEWSRFRHGCCRNFNSAYLSVPLRFCGYCF